VVGTAIALVLARSARFDPRAFTARLVGRAGVGDAPEPI
jgi:hypothetical protein